MLTVENIEVRYGGSEALRGAGLEVNRGELVAVVGPNGAGKTTLFKAISGTVPAAGRVTFEGADLLAMKPRDRAHLGIAHVPEGRKVFASMSVLENLEMGGSTEAGRADRRRAFERIFAMFPILAERRAQLAGTLSGGQQQMLAIGRALASCPRLLMLDEPSMGLSPVMADTIFDAVREIRREGGMTILLVEQRVTDALADCDRGYVLEGGRVMLHGTPAELSPEKLRRAYLGV
ncbi:ABC transporter ATP-binding protein [Roseomonas haemaphysalidis]|uniref:ABC transporter ATP-binding protein n=1 Tax=Roseomonas haemaphysalidis TaxID=2768162 RepID=A0ABS3KV10_9PROT|nr:ABC transporter ATP-binding protein [Roseomonas haemaphysalidis]MBO1081314.1 ABC transporter ATP-binding protein [Roseomonas haemaphysalidis]